MDEIVERVVERIIGILPAIMGNLVRSSHYLNTITKKFYDEYPDLRAHGDTVAKMIERYEMKNPGLPLENGFEEIAGEVRKLVGTTKRLQPSLGEL